MGHLLTPLTVSSTLAPPSPASFGWRACAWYFDVSLASLPALLLTRLLISNPSLPDTVSTPAQAQSYLSAYLGIVLLQLFWTIVLTAMIYGLGSVMSEAGSSRATWGKRLLGLETVDLNGLSLSHSRVACRFLSGFLSWITLNAGHVLVAFRKDRRALHDLVAGTQVVMYPMTSGSRWPHATAIVFVAIAVSSLPALMLPSDPLLEQALKTVAGSMGVYY